MCLDDAATIARDLADDPEVLTGGDRLSERDVDLRGYAPDALVKYRPAHGLVEKRSDHATVEQAVITLVPLQRRVTRFRAIARNLEVEAQAARVQLATCETPVLEVDAEV